MGKRECFYKGKRDQMDILLFGNNFLDYTEKKITQMQFAENLGISVPTLNKHMDYWVEKLYIEMQLGILRPVMVDENGNKIEPPKPDNKEVEDT